MELLSPKVDFIFKKIFGNEKKPQILISFLNAVMYEGKDIITEVEINNTDIEKDYIDDKYSRLDIKATTNQKEIINIEIQRANKQNMVERTLYYWSKLYSDKIIRGEDYRSLPRTVCINVLDYKMPELKDIESYHSVYQLQNRADHHILTNKLELHFIELPKFKISDEESLLELWLEFIENPDSKKLEKAKASHESMKEAKETLEVISGNDIERARYHKREETLMETYNALIGNYNVGVEQGMKQGMEKGIEKGIKQGEQNKIYELARNLLDILDDETIASKTGLSLEEVEGLRKK